MVRFTPRKRPMLLFLCFFGKHDFELIIFKRVKFGTEKKHKLLDFEFKKDNNALNFELKNLQRVKFGIEKKTTRSKLNSKIWTASDFEAKFLQRVRFLIKSVTTCQMLNQKIFIFPNVKF